ncbi:MAG: cyclopropane fatty acyl phospholipid synthase [Gammaproteobacteria bacterium]
MTTPGDVLPRRLPPPPARRAGPFDGLIWRTYERLLARADIRVGGDRAWDMRVHEPRLFRRCVLQGSLGLGEAYLEGWWDVPALDQFFERLVRSGLDRRALNLRGVLSAVIAACRNLQDARLARRVAEVHYDLNNAFYREMLGGCMVYTCGYWAHADTLDAAQAHKLDLVCRKLGLAQGQRVLDIGCGWGSFARFAAERYGAHVVGVTISKEQAAYAREICAGLPVQIRLCDYRDVDEQFDHIVSLGMFEHVGRKNYATYFDRARRNLAPEGLFLLHTIGRSDPGSGIDPWVTKYIFPNSEIPGLARLAHALNRRFVVEDLHNFGADYARTLMCWYDNFMAAWPRFADSMPPRFHRLWRYYLLLFAGVFRARGLQLWQLVLSRDGLPGGYRRPAF